MNHRKKKHRIYAMSKTYHESRHWLTDEEYAWKFMRPVGREFASPDFERLAELDALADAAVAAANLAATSMDETERFVHESNQRIQSMEWVHAKTRNSHDDRG
ncbi:hypothetical protein [Noviherbaspirillum sedimenti]|uniref:Uncharacterized protein n=1 Tax=Noviherbaspirillum sedimenti TaxID=2320865 RepID=A0A3A3GNV9_9BURK|nr:hypothetical protein [Noviherbaspirillum sedimenti]RJG02640.1 hypothetical protein D3878_14525 [Noviherbaspirillum sedimenti]